MSLNLLTHPEFCDDLFEVLETISLDGMTNPEFCDDLFEVLETTSLDEMTDIDINTSPEEILDLVNDNIFFQKLLILTKKAVATGDNHIADGMKLFFIEMAERRLKQM